LVKVIEFKLSVEELIGDLEDIRFYDLSVTQPKSDRNFILLNVPKAFQQAGRRKIVSQLSKQKRNRELEQLFEHGGNKERNKAVAEWQELNMGRRESFDRDLGDLICEPCSFWQEDNVLYKAYAEASKLRQDRIQLMFFQVGRFDLDPESKDIWSPIEKFNWANYLTDWKKINLKRQQF